MPAALRIDAHHHLWRYSPAEYGWIDGAMSSLQRDFLPADLSAALRSAKIDAAIAVQARQSIAETEFLLECAASSPDICGIVGWAPLAAPELSAVLDRFADEAMLVGYREIAQGRPAGFFDDAGFNKGIRQLTQRNLTYDVLVFERQLPEVIRFVDRHPEQRFILDHAAKPLIAAGELEPWATNLRELARRPNVACKLSGFVTEADWHQWTPHAVGPYLDTCVEAFGTARLLAGSDWPVCLVATTYDRWFSVLCKYFAAFTPAEQDRIFGRNAMELYRVPVRNAAPEVLL